jgi:hypothetical protein
MTTPREYKTLAQLQPICDLLERWRTVLDETLRTDDVEEELADALNEVRINLGLPRSPTPEIMP